MSNRFEKDGDFDQAILKCPVIATYHAAEDKLDTDDSVLFRKDCGRDVFVLFVLIRAILKAESEVIDEFELIHFKGDPDSQASGLARHPSLSGERVASIRTALEANWQEVVEEGRKNLEDREKKDQNAFRSLWLLHEFTNTAIVLLKIAKE